MRRWFDEMQEHYVWKSPDDWHRAYQIFAELEEQLMAGCLQQLIDEQQRLYRLLDASLNGTQYELVGDVISPALATVPSASTGAPNALRSHVGRLWQLAENTTTGATYAAGAGIDGSPELADDQAVRAVIRRLIEGVDGGATPAPDDNLLMALRGTSVATTDRNVIDRNITKLSELLTRLTEIRDKLV
jgi:hypothetical protein